MRADLRYDTRNLLDRTGGSIDVRAAQLGRQQMPAAKHVKRQVAVALVVAVKEAPFLIAVQRIVGRVQVQRDLLRRLRMRLHKQIDEQPLDRRRIVRDLLVVPRGRAAQLQTVQRALAGKRRTVRALGLELAGKHRKDRVVA